MLTFSPVDVDCDRRAWQCSFDALDAVPGAKAREAASIIIKNSAMLVRLPLGLLLQHDLHPTFKL